MWTSFSTNRLRPARVTGRYYQQTRTLEMCSLEKDIMLHELAHAWANHNLTDEEKEELTIFRGLRAWNDHDLAWEERGTEHAAEIVAWALLDEPNHVRWIETTTEGEVVESFRLLTIENSDVEAMVEAFHFLTGQDPIFRSVEEWSAPDTTPDPASVSPEMRAAAVAEASASAPTRIDDCADLALLLRFGLSLAC